MRFSIRKAVLACRQFYRIKRKIYLYKVERSHLRKVRACVNAVKRKKKTNKQNRGEVVVVFRNSTPSSLAITPLT